MTTFTNTGRAAVAHLLQARHQADPYSMFLAFGTGESWWAQEQTEIIAFDAGDQLVTMHPHADASTVPGALPVRVSTSDDATTYVAGTDYAVSEVTGVITRLNGGAIAAEATVKLVYTAEIPAPAKTDTGLVTEIGRVRILSLDHVLPISEVSDPNPVTVTVENEIFAFVVDPSRHLYTQANLAAHEGVGDAISEFALVIDAAVDPALPPGQLFYSGAEVTQTGTAVLIRRAVPAPHGGAHSLGTQMKLEL